MLEPKFHLSNSKNKDFLYNCILDKPIHSIDPWTTCSWVKPKRVKILWNLTKFELIQTFFLSCQRGYRGPLKTIMQKTKVLALIFCIVTVNASQMYINRNFTSNFSIFLVFNCYFSKWRMCIPRCFKKWNLLYKWRMLGKKWDCEWQLCCWVCQSKYNNIFFWDVGN